ncbi:hypothetical protein SLEP1_g22687 [Rubroshorea leprosula]|uniref:Uncharacterized protein n=1 Tax=Rubroshorea leprosula TaxID=152421 RepID=A0AAV5JKD5_9ROSI|nr:hypothetical protein SLEP1_g22687 [Rubroshorea leprosula]
MSSKETLSIGGSEEVRMLEYSDVSVKGVLSGSERTEGGVGKNEVVEVGVEEVPANILEVGDRSDKFYDSGVNIVSEAYWSERKGMLCTPRSLDASKAKKANQNKYSLNSDEEEEVEKLVNEEGDIIDIMFLTSSDVIEAAELYGSSSMSEVEMDKFLGATGRVAIPKKPRKKSRLWRRLQVGREIGTRKKAQKKKRRVEDEVRGDKVVEFVPRPAPVELGPNLRENEVLTPNKGKAFVPTPSLQSSIFGNKNFTVAKSFMNAYAPEMDRRKAREEALVHEGTSVVRHSLETATWVNALAQEFMELVKERNSLQKERDELLKKNGKMKRELDIMVPIVTSLQEEGDTLKTILSFVEKKRRMCKEENEAQKEEIRKMRESEVELKKNIQLLVHNGMEEHISNFINSSSFDNIVNLYRLLIAILTFTNCRKKVKIEYPEVDITKITFGEQKEGVEENDESMSVDFQPQDKLRWDHDEEGRAVFPPNFDFKFIAVEEGEGEAKGVEVEESQPSPPMEVHLIPSKEEQPPLPSEQEPPQPPPPAK